MGFDTRKREEELLSRLEPLLKEAEEKQTVPADQVVKERTLLQAACKDYVNSRNSFMAQMIDGMSSNNGDQENPYKNAINSLSPVVSRSFSERVKNVGTPSPQADLFCMRVEMEEATFMKALEQTVIAASKRDYLYKYEGIIKKQIEDLDKRWTEVTKAHQNYDAVEKQITDELTNLIKEASQAAAAKTATKGETAIRYIDTLLKLPTPPGVLGDGAKAVLAVIKESVSYWKGKTDMFSSRLKQFQDAYKSEVGTTLVLFKDFREETQEFIDDFGYDKAEDEKEAGDSALNSFVSSCATDAQKSDATVFADEAKKALAAKLSIAKNIWDDFVKKNEKKFFGPVGPEIAEGLLSTSAWKDRKAALAHTSLHALLKEWRDESRNHQFIEIANKGGELQLLVQPLVDELVVLRAEWEKTMEAVWEFERLNEQREKDAQNLS